MEPNIPSLRRLARRPAQTRAPLQRPRSLRKPTALPERDEQLEETPEPAPHPTRSGPTLSTLPPELHLLIARHLIYPDALSLKHTSRHFYHLVDTGVRLKVEWLMERRLLHLECPSDQRCDLGSDLRFCRGSVKLLMQRRREHVECESRPGLGCLIYGTRTCPHARELRTRFKKWARVRSLDPVRWWLLLASLLPVVIGWVWIVGALLF